MFETTELPVGRSPVITMSTAGAWLAVKVEQMESVVLAPQLWSAPLGAPGFLGLHDAGERLVPVLRLRDPSTPTEGEQLIAILHVRGEPVGLAIDRAGRVHDRYWIDNEPTAAPIGTEGISPRLAHTGDHSFWIIDPDRLWIGPDNTSAASSPAS